MKSCIQISDFPARFTDEFIEVIKERIKNYRLFLYVASDFKGYASSEKYSRRVLNQFEEAGIRFDETAIIDDRKKIDEIKRLFKEADVIWLAGGKTLLQMEYFRQFIIKELIQQSKALVIGQSAGAMNMPEKAVLAKNEEDDIPVLSIYEGLGLTKVCIEPHLNMDRIQAEEMKEAARVAEIIGLYDNSFVLTENGQYKIVGNHVIFKED